jgi:predicted nucleic acid-binding protein
MLDRGEAEVIAWAEELSADEGILDERAARVIAITRDCLSLALLVY